MMCSIQIILLLFALHSLCAYTVVRIELKNGTEVSEVKELKNNTLEFISAESKLPTLRQIIFVVDKPEKDSTVQQETPQEIPIQLEGSLRPFTNGHGYQFVEWQLVDEHQSRTDDKARDKTDNDSDSDDADDDDHTADEETDTHDDYNEVAEIPAMGTRHQTVDLAKTLRNKMFDKMKEKYHNIKRNNVDATEKIRRKRQYNYQNIPGASPQYNFDQAAIPDYTNRMLVNRPPYDNSKKVMNPVFRDENGIVFYDNMNAVNPSGRQHGSVPRGYGMNSNNDQGYSMNNINNIHNEPGYNHHISQPIQQRPIDGYAVNNNPYIQAKQAISPDVELRNVQQIPNTDINKIDNVPKSKQPPNSEPVQKEITITNITQVIDADKAKYNGEVNTTFKHNREMVHNVNQMSKKIGSIKEIVKDRFANINSMINTPEGKKLLKYYEMALTGDKQEITNDIAASHVNIEDLISPKNITKDNKVEVIPDTITELNDVENLKVFEGTYSNEGNDVSLNNSLNKEAENVEFKINEEIEKQVEISTNSNNINQNINESTTNQIILVNKCENPEPSATEMLNTACNQTINIKDDEPTFESKNFDFRNETSIAETKEEDYTELLEEAKIETKQNITNEENVNCKENCHGYDSKNVKVSENLNLDDLFNTDEFWEWLFKWTTDYMEILKENIEIIVKEEVAKQLQELQKKPGKKTIKDNEKVHKELEK